MIYKFLTTTLNALLAGNRLVTYQSDLAPRVRPKNEIEPALKPKVGHAAFGPTYFWG